jgi:3,4-dihydroxy-2-butanone 4-phosphate synthase
MMAAEMITPEAVNFMATHGRGICVAMTGERLDELKLAQIVQDNTALCGTAFTVSIDAHGYGVTTGISANDRAQTIWAAPTYGRAFSSMRLDNSATEFRRVPYSAGLWLSGVEKTR